jgi:integrase
VGDIVRAVRAGKFIGWYVRYKDLDGRRKQRASHQPTKDLARRFLLEVEGRIARGAIGIPEPAPPAPTIAQLAERFLAEYSRPKIKDLARYRVTARTALRRLLPLIGALRIDAVTPQQIQRARDHLASAFAANSARVSLAHLGTMFSWAVRVGFLPHSPMRSVELPARQALVEYLTREEIATLLTTSERRATNSVAERLLHVCVRLAIHTGLRKGELLGLRWRDVDLESLRLTVARSFRGLPKGGHSRHLRLPDSIAPVLADWRQHCPETREGVVFPRRQRTGWTMARHSGEMLGLPELLAEAGCRPLLRPWHALRHTFASHFIMQGGNILALQKILGHSDIKMTLVYAHLAPDFLGDELNRLKF